jgi:hypothetical protein
MQYHLTSLMPSLSLVVSLVSGCFNPGSHVQLQPPPARTAPLPEREAAYENLRPRAQVDTVFLQNGQQVAQQPKFIMLRDGRRVYLAEDLGAVVPPQSPTAQAAQRSKRAGDRIHTWQLAGYVVAGAGAAATIASFATSPRPGDDGFRTNLAVGGAGIVLTAVGVAIAVYGALANATEFTDERATAFALYDEDLRKGLDLCVAGTSIVACEPAGPLERKSPSAIPLPPAPAPGPAAPEPVPPPSTSPAPPATSP